MTKLTKEEQIQAIYDLKVGYTLGHADIAILKALARQLLAGMEQEPVYQACKEAGVWVDIEPDDVDSLKANGEQVRALYAAPQLTQPAMVSDEMINTFEAEFRRAFKVSDGVEQLIEIGYQGEKFSLSIRDAATWWKLGRATILKHSAPFIVTSDPCMMEMPKDADIDTITPMLQGTSTPFVFVK